jgi:hypothetical protein
MLTKRGNILPTRLEMWKCGVPAQKLWQHMLMWFGPLSVGSICSTFQYGLSVGVLVREGVRVSYLVLS